MLYGKDSSHQRMLDGLMAAYYKAAEAARPKDAAPIQQVLPFTASKAEDKKRLKGSIFKLPGAGAAGAFTYAVTEPTDAVIDLRTAADPKIKWSKDGGTSWESIKASALPNGALLVPGVLFFGPGRFGEAAKSLRIGRQPITIGPVPGDGARLTICVGKGRAEDKTVEEAVAAAGLAWLAWAGEAERPAAIVTAADVDDRATSQAKPILSNGWTGPGAMIQAAVLGELGAFDPGSASGTAGDVAEFIHHLTGSDAGTWPLYDSEAAALALGHWATAVDATSSGELRALQLAGDVLLEALRAYASACPAGLLAAVGAEAGKIRSAGLNLSAGSAGGMVATSAPISAHCVT